MDYYVMEEKLIVKLKDGIILKKVKADIYKLLKETGTQFAYVRDHNGKFIKTLEGDSVINFEEIMQQVGSLGGRSRKSKAINAQKIAD